MAAHTPHCTPAGKASSSTPPTIAPDFSYCNWVLPCQYILAWSRNKDHQKEKEIHFRKLEWVCGVSVVDAFYCPKPENPAYCSNINSILSFPSSIISVPGRESPTIASLPTRPKKRTQRTVCKQMAICLQNNNLQPYWNSLSLSCFWTKHLVILCTAWLSVLKQASDQDMIKIIILGKKHTVQPWKKDNLWNWQIRFILSVKVRKLLNLYLSF